MFRRLTTPQLVFDVALAAACVALRLALFSESAVTVVVVLLMGAALALRRYSPGIALAVAWLGATTQMAFQLSPDPANLAILAVLFTTARYGEGIVKWAGLVSAGVGAVVATAYTILVGGLLSPGVLVDAPRITLLSVIALLSALAVLGSSWTVGLLVRTWATARDNRLAQRAAEQTVVVEQERNRIARDMHDVVAHSLAVVIAQADGARYAQATDPKAVDTALATIATTSREALADVRLLLGQLRHDQERGPQPALADLDALVQQLRASGLDIVVERTGTEHVLPTGAQLAIYRIVQESLTNALRHGDAAAPVTLTLVNSADAVELTVSSGLRPGRQPDPVAGHGLTGMRERALLVGGTLTAAPEGDRFVVTARVPA